MGRKEDPVIAYYEKEGHFAELLNGWLFGGKKVIHAEQVHAIDRRYTGKSGKKYSFRYRSRYRDIVKKIDGFRVRVVIGAEIQSYIDYAMPVRAMDYDAVEYGRQIANIRQTYKEENPKKVFLSALKKTDRLVPVLTLVLYLGVEPWDGAKSLHGILDFSKVPEEFRRYIPDYPVYVLDICHEADKRILEFPENIACMFLILKYQKDKKRLLEILECIDAFQYLDEEIYDTVWEYTGEKRLLELKEQMTDQNGGVNMCEAIREIVKDAKMEGLNEGISQGVMQGVAQGIKVFVETLKELGVEEGDISAKIVEKFKLSITDAEQYVLEYGDKK